MKEFREMYMANIGYYAFGVGLSLVFGAIIMVPYTIYELKTRSK